MPFRSCNLCNESRPDRSLARMQCRDRKACEASLIAQGELALAASVRERAEQDKELRAYRKEVKARIDARFREANAPVR